MALAQTNNWKICPSCSSMVERVNGCDHMTCRCGIEFCYRCGGLYRQCPCALGNQYPGRTTEDYLIRNRGPLFNRARELVQMPLIRQQDICSPSFYGQKQDQLLQGSASPNKGIFLTNLSFLSLKPIVTTATPQPIQKTSFSANPNFEAEYSMNPESSSPVTRKNIKSHPSSTKRIYDKKKQRFVSNKNHSSQNYKYTQKTPVNHNISLFGLASQFESGAISLFGALAPTTGVAANSHSANLITEGTQSKNMESSLTPQIEDKSQVISSEIVNDYKEETLQEFSPSMIANASTQSNASPLDLSYPQAYLQGEKPTVFFGIQPTEMQKEYEASHTL